MLNIVVTTAFEDMAEADKIAVDIRQRVFEGITHTGLRCKIHHTLRFISFEKAFHASTIGQIDPDHVHLPGIYVDRIVVNATPEKRIEQRTVRQVEGN